MSKPFPTRIRTFLVPLAGVALYYFIQVIALYSCSFIFKDTDSLSLLSKHYGSYMIITVILMAVCLFMWLFAAQKTTWNTIRKDYLTGSQVLISIPIALAMLGAINLYMVGLQFLSEQSHLIKDMLTEYSVNTSLPNTTTGLEAAGYYIGVGVFIPIIEELIFRGIILGEFLATMKADIAVFLAALIFGTMHMQPVQIGYAFVCGLILGYVYFYSNSIFLSIAIHIVFNLLGGILPVLLSDNPSFMNALGYLEIWFILIGVLCILYLRKKYINKTIQGV